MNSILIADDNPENLKLLCALLKPAGYKIRVATNGKQALESFQAQPVDLVIVDIQMPQMDGYDVCRRIKQHEDFRLVPVIFISAMDEEFNKALAFEAGGSDYITKPIQAEEVLARVRTHLSLYRYQRDLEDKNRACESLVLKMQRMEAIGTLASGITHDFNNILSAILGFTEIALDQTPEGTVVESNLQEVYSAGKRARELVKQILTIARSSEEDICPIQPGRIAKEVLKFIRSSTPATIEVVHRIENVWSIMGDEIQIHQLLMNLCTNAVQAMQESGGVLTLVIKEVHLGRQDVLAGMEPGVYAEIKVSDTGVGISSEKIPLIFDPYFTTKGPGEGTDLGLATVRGIVKKHNGQIDVVSQPGNGTTFTIHMPVSGIREAPPQVQEPTKLPLGTEKILLVDDEIAIVKMGTRLLERLGYQVTSKTSGMDALQLFQENPLGFDLVLTDMTMSEMTGDTLALALMEIRPDIPVVLCSGYSGTISSKAAEQMGVKALIPKPFLVADLAITVRKVLDAVQL